MVFVFAWAWCGYLQDDAIGDGAGRRRLWGTGIAYSTTLLCDEYGKRFSLGRFRLVLLKG